MKKIYAYLSAALITIASLSSCSRSDYAFKSAVSPYRVTAATPEKVNSSTALSSTAPTVGSPLSTTPTPVLRISSRAAQPQPATVAQAKPAKHDASVHLAKPIAKANKLQRIMVAKVVKQLHKNQEITHVSQVQSRAGRAAIIGLIGILLALIGGAIGNGFGGLIALIGIIAFIVGVVMLIVALVNGG